MKQRILAIFFFACVFALLMKAEAYSFHRDMRAEIDSLREEIREKKDAGLLEEARALQDVLREKVSSRHGDRYGEERDYDGMIQDRIKAHQEERRQAHKQRYTSSRGGRSSKGGKGQPSSKFSDSRALHQMDQSNRKADILRNKIQRGSSLFLLSEIDAYNKRVTEYLEQEEKVASLLQQTSDDYNKARSMRDKDARLNHIEGAKARKQKRHEEEHAQREISRQKFFSLNDELDARLDAAKNEL